MNAPMKPPMDTLHDPGEHMAVLATGDWWLYDVQGSATRGPETLRLQGTVRVTIEERPAQRSGEAGCSPRRAIVFQPDHRIVGVPGPSGVFPMPTGLFFFEQDPARGDVLITGDNMGPGGADRTARVPQVFYPGRFAPDTAYDNVLDFGAHGRVANVLRTLGVEQVDTALGRCAAWKAEVTSSSEQFGRVVGIDWWRPAFGAPVRFEMTARGPDGGSLHTAAVLRASNRPLG